VTLLTGSSSTVVEAGIEACWAVVADVTRVPEWQQGFERLEVVARDEQGRPLICDTVNDAKITKVHCRVRMSYDPPHRLSWTRVESDDVDAMDGCWELEQLDERRTRATYRLSVDPGRVGFLARPLERALRPLIVGRRAEELARAVAQRS
jgi:hypothetical protein